MVRVKPFFICYNIIVILEGVGTLDLGSIVGGGYVLKIHIEYILKGQEIKFYKSRPWKDKRKEILKRDNNECQSCKSKGRFSPADCIHHKIHLKDNPLLGLTNSNLVSLCNACHNREHPEKFIKARGFTMDEGSDNDRDSMELNPLEGKEFKERW